MSTGGKAKTLSTGGRRLQLLEVSSTEIPDDRTPVNPMGAGGRNWISKVPLRYVVAAMAKLPPCERGADGERVDVDAGAAGKFRITFTCVRKGKHLAQGAFWMAVHAERLDVGP